MLFMMIGNGEAVHLLLNIGNKRKRRPVGIDLNLSAAVSDFPGAVFAVLHHTKNRSGEFHFFDHREYGAYLPLAAVQQDQIRQDLKCAASLIVIVMIEPACKHLIHRPDVVLPVKPFH